jgi:hypothetical protein
VDNESDSARPERIPIMNYGFTGLDATPRLNNGLMDGIMVTVDESRIPILAKCSYENWPRK